MSGNKAYVELIHRIKDCRLLESCGQLLGWDERTYMPRQGSRHRGEQMALLARLSHEMLTSPEIGNLLSEAEASDSAAESDSVEAANVREIRRRMIAPPSCHGSWSKSWPASRRRRSRFGSRRGVTTNSNLFSPGLKRLCGSSVRRHNASATVALPTTLCWTNMNRAHDRGDHPRFRRVASRTGAAGRGDRGVAQNTCHRDTGTRVRGGPPGDLRPGGCCRDWLRLHRWQIGCDNASILQHAWPRRYSPNYAIQPAPFQRRILWHPSRSRARHLRAKSSVGVFRHSLRLRGITWHS